MTFYEIKKKIPASESFWLKRGGKGLCPYLHSQKKGEFPLRRKGGR